MPAVNLVSCPKEGDTEEKSKSPTISVGMEVSHMAGKQPHGGEGNDRERIKCLHYQTKYA